MRTEKNDNLEILFVKIRNYTTPDCFGLGKVNVYGADAGSK